MSRKRTLVSILVLGMFLLMVSTAGYAGIQQKGEKKKAEVPQQKPIFIPPQVKEIIEAGIQTREPNLTIPFEIENIILLPARDNSMHGAFLFRIKNSELGYIPVGVPAEESAEAPALYQSNAHVFLQFNRVDETGLGELVKEVYIPAKLQVKGAEYDPEKTELYSAGYPLLAGRYLLSMAVASQQLERCGVQYMEFDIPDAASAADKLATTPIIFTKTINKVESPDMRPQIHRGFFKYSIIEITPDREALFAPGASLDVLFYIFGIQPKEDGIYDFQIQFEVTQDNKPVIRYAAQLYDSPPLISQPIPLKKTVLVRETDKEGNVTERKEQRDLEPGKYVINFLIKDNVSGLELKKSKEFEVK